MEIWTINTLIRWNHRVIILNRGSMFAFQWREFSPPLSSAHRLLRWYHRQKRDRRRCNSQGIPPQPPATRAISQWACSLEWRHAVTLHILVGIICISFFLFYCEGMLSLVVLWLCGWNSWLIGYVFYYVIWDIFEDIFIIGTAFKVYTNHVHVLISNWVKNNPHTQKEIMPSER